jgi:hypothetical protein
MTVTKTIIIAIHRYRELQNYLQIYNYRETEMDTEISPPSTHTFIALSMYSEVVMFFYPNFDVTPNIVKFGKKHV